MSRARRFPMCRGRSSKEIIPLYFSPSNKRMGKLGSLRISSIRLMATLSQGKWDNGTITGRCKCIHRNNLTAFVPLSLPFGVTHLHGEKEKEIRYGRPFYFSPYIHTSTYQWDNGTKELIFLILKELQCPVIVPLSH